MKTFIKKYKIPKYRSNIFETYFGGLNPCVLDIETTGLSPSRSKIILIGLLIETDDGLEITQFFAETFEDEREILIATQNYLNKNNIGYLVTFNGDRFDIPFLNSRLVSCGMDFSLNLYNYDLYKFVKHYSGIGKLLPSLTQKNLEKYLKIGNSRRDIIDGRENARLYFDYLKTENNTNKQLILTHNREDVFQLYRLLNVNQSVDLHAALYRYGFPFNQLASKVKPKLNKNSLILTGTNINYPHDLIVFPESATSLYVNIEHKNNMLTVELPLLSHDDSLYFDLTKLDYNALLYDYLSIENLDGFASDYLILKINGKKKYREVNALSILLLDHITKKYS